MATRPSVSAIVTAYNSGRFIGDALSSVRGQTHQPDELIVVDDGSTDDTGAIVRSLGSDIRYAWQSNRGEAAARNQGISLARSDVIAFLDADDAWLPGRLASLLDRLAGDPPAEIVCGRARAFSNGSWTDALNPGADHPEAFAMSFGCAVIRRSLFERIGSVDESMGHCVDLDWFLRCREQNVAIAVVDEIVLLYRRHDQNMTQNKDAGREGLMRTVRQSLARRRVQGQVPGSLARWETLDGGKE